MAQSAGAIGGMFPWARAAALQTGGTQGPDAQAPLTGAPFRSDSMEPGALIRVATEGVPDSAASQAEAIELSLWQLASKVDQAAGYQEYLRQYPTGRFAFFAQQRLSQLIPQGAPAPVPPVAPAPVAPPPVAAPPVAAPPVAAPPVAAPLVAPPPVAVAPPVAPPLDPGFPAVLTREQVRLAQESLEALGFDPGGHDGVFGARTSSAVMKYQFMTGAPQTGLLTALQYGTLVASVTEAQRAEVRRAPPKKTVRSKSKTPKDPLAYDDNKSNYKALDETYGRVGNSGHVCRIRADLCEAGWD
jgi:peptidoglycan hydrolase-like protein with peptidoglycan-binding domain